MSKESLIETYNLFTQNEQLKQNNIQYYNFIIDELVKHWIDNTKHRVFEVIDDLGDIGCWNL